MGSKLTPLDQNTYFNQNHVTKIKPKQATSGTTSQPSLDIAMDYAKKAILADKNRSYEEAVKFYEKSIQKFDQVLKSNELEKQQNEVIKNKNQEYSKRAQKLSNHLNKQNNQLTKASDKCKQIADIGKQQNDKIHCIKITDFQEALITNLKIDKNQDKIMEIKDNKVLRLDKILINKELSHQNAEKPQEKNHIKGENVSNIVCKICFETPEINWILSCGHLPFCEECIKRISDDSKCPICRENVTSIMKAYF